MSSRSISLTAADIGEAEQLLVQEVLRSGQLSNGPMLEQLEMEFANRFGARHAIAVSSGTAAIHLSLLAAGVEDGDIVITTPFSFIATANPILYERAVPLFIDIERATLTIDPSLVVEAIDAVVNRRHGWRSLLPPSCGTITGKVRAVIPVDLFGRVARMQEIVAAAHAAGIAVIEDACEAVGASLDGVPAGRWGDAAAFSFFSNKQMTSGEGGLVLTDNDSWARLIRSLRSQGRSEDGSWLRHQRIGYNYRLNELSAAVGLGQLRRLDELLKKRRAVAELYDRRLSRIEGVEPIASSSSESISWFMYLIRVLHGTRDELASDLAARGIQTRPYFWPIHLQPPYRDRFGFERGAYPQSEDAGDALLAIPFHGNLSAEDIEYVCNEIERSIRHSPAAAQALVSRV
jgi:dTDP-4-amino-4,6-dideoxygalactose transaminase